MGFIKSNGIFIIIGFIVVVLAAIGFLAYQRLQTVQTTQEQTPADNTGELTFSLDQSPTPEETSEPISAVETPTPTGTDPSEAGTEEDGGDPLTATTQTPTPSSLQTTTPTSAITPTAATSLTTTPAVGGPSGSDGEEIALGPTLTPTRTLAPTRTPTRTPTPAAGDSTITTPFPTTIEDPSIPAPDVPEAGGFEPTLIAIVGGSGIVGLAFLLRRTTI